MKRSLILILIVVVLSVIFNLPANIRPKIGRDLSLRLGLDLQGGTHLAYEADTSKLSSSEAASAVESAKLNIERRVNSLGVAEPLIQVANSNGTYRLVVELAAITNVQEALNLIGKTAQLDFRETPDATPSANSVFLPTGLTGADLKLAQVQFTQASQNINSEPSVSLEFNPDGAKKFADITAKNIGKPLAIYLDNIMVSAPIVNTAITDGRASISGNFSVETAKQLVIQLNAGALPVPIKLVEQRTVGATLGQESIVRSLVAGLIGLFLVWLFMAISYGRFGLVANLALAIYILLSLAVIRLIPITLTLAGIAGFILSIGMAVDANILIFERIKEERRWGRSLQAAIQLGFHRAWASIRDSNASTIITSGILFWFGTGQIRGFALTLCVGVLISLFSAIFVTQTLLKLLFIKK
jgi:preprotein translocase subunit SecD